jgi:hypothetical protein
MSGRLLYFMVSVLLVNSIAPRPAYADIVGWWKLNDGGGTLAADSSGNGHDGTVSGTAHWVAGQLGGALQFDGAATYVNCGVLSVATDGVGGLSVAAWINRSAAGDHKLCSNRQVDSSAGGGFTCAIYNNRMEMDLEDAKGRLLSRDGTRPTLPGVNTWVHVAWVYDDPADTLKLYVNGELSATATVTQSIGASTAYFRIGSDAPTLGHWFSGIVDDLRLYDHAISDVEVKNAMQGLGIQITQATNPTPKDGQSDVRRDIALTWRSGETARTHDVYFGTSFEDVNVATPSDPRGVLVGAGQDANTYDPQGLLTLGQTYYWRVDEVNGAPDFTVFRGAVWSFTVEPVAYTVDSVTATASSSYTANMGPEKTIDGSGLDDQDQHGTAIDTMWLSGSEPTAWIQYEFDRVYNLYQMWVWNSNQSVEFLLGLGVKGVQVEYSTDGESWTTLEGVAEFAQAPGAPGYAHNTTIDFHGAAAQFVRITITSDWGGRTQYGLSEVRFYYVPLLARDPQPVDGQTGVDPQATLIWRSGRNVVSHQIYLSSDLDAVINATTPPVTTTDTSYTTPTLKLGTQYYWRIDEVNQADTSSVWAGDVWSFSTMEYYTAEGFETYTDDPDNRIFDTWVDGWQVPENGSQVGYAQSPFAEKTIVHSGKQSMPLIYDNSGTVNYSEALRIWQEPQDWTFNGADTLSLYVRGNPVGFLELSSNHILMNGVGTDIYGTADQGRFVYKQLSADGSIIAKIDRLDETDPWAKAGVMIRAGLQASSSWAYILASAANGVHFQARLSMAASATSDTSLAQLPDAQTAARIPVWVKLERTGNQFNGYYAIGETVTTWTPIPWNPQTITMNASVYVGLAVTSHVSGTVTQAEFSEISTTGTVVGSWQSVSLGVDQPLGNTPDTLYVTVTDSTGDSVTVKHPDSLIATTATWQAWPIPFSDLASVNMSRVKSMAVGVGDRTAPGHGAGTLYIDDIQYGSPIGQ